MAGFREGLRLYAKGGVNFTGGLRKLAGGERKLPLSCAWSQLRNQKGLRFFIAESSSGV